MKKMIFVVFIITMYVNAVAQKWALPSSTWIVSYSWVSPAYYTTIKVESDTIIDGISCKKIGNISPIYTYESNDTAYIYIVGKFRPTYYFNAHVGDTISFYNVNYSDGFCGIDSIVYAVIDNIDSVDVGNKFLKKYNGVIISDTMPNGNSFSYTEYIGSNYIFPYLYCPNIIDQESYGICNYGDSTIQNFYSFQNNCLNVSVDNIFHDKNISVYPNPVSSQININSKYYDIQEIFIYNIHGQLQKTDTYFNHPREIQVDVNKLSSGIYFLHLRFSNGESYMQKILKD